MAMHSHGTSHLPFFMTRLYDLADMRLGPISYLAIFLKQDRKLPVKRTVG
jgi:hypothetical protein